MVEVTVVSWRDIPAQLLVGKGRSATRIALPERFEQAIDRAAMKGGLAGTDAYLGEWRREVVEADDPAALAARIDAEHDLARIKTLIGNHGWATPRPDNANP